MFPTCLSAGNVSIYLCCCLVDKLCPTLCDPMDYIAHQAPLFMEFSMQEYWNGLLFLSLEDLLDSGTKPTSELAGRFFTKEPPGSPSIYYSLVQAVSSVNLLKRWLIRKQEVFLQRRPITLFWNFTVWELYFQRTMESILEPRGKKNKTLRLFMTIGDIERWSCSIYDFY